MINYIIQVMLFQLAFLSIYDLFLRKETFFRANRFYLLFTPILSFLIPFIKISSFQSEYTNEVSILLPEIVLSPQSVLEKSSVIQSMNYNYVAIIFWIGFMFFLALFFFKLLKLNAIIKKSQIQMCKDFKLVTVSKTRKAFSFFNYIFLGDEISENDKRKIIKHEIVHSRQKHSIDLMIFELLKVVMWYNPLLYIFQKRIATTHEFLSDSFVVKTIEKNQYVNTLLNELFEVDNFSFINQFSKKSILKQRIIMMTKEKSKQIMQAKYLLLLPLLLGMLFYVSCSDEFVTNEVFKPTKALKVIHTNFNNDLKTYAGKKEGYIDLFMGGPIDSSFLVEEIKPKDLLPEEKLEYDEIMKVFSNQKDNKTNSAFFSTVKYKLFRTETKRAVLFQYTDWEKFQKIGLIEDSKRDIPFSLIEKIPTFPGCSENDKSCFNKKLQEHFITNFDKNLPNKLGLSSGKKRMVMIFKIDTSGEIVDVKVKAPAKKLEEEAERIIKMLPKMIPGEQDGKKVNVKYTLPLRIDVE